MLHFIKHAVDIVNQQRITGWCYSALLKNMPVILQVFAGREKLGEIVADDFRQDLKDLGLHPTGRCGFRYYFPADFSPKPGQTIRLVPKRGIKTLERYVYEDLPQVNDRNSGKGIVFMHIPKTAGTSFNANVRRFFPEDKSIIHIEAVKEDIDPAAYQYIAGHYIFGQLQEKFPADKFSYYSIIREPYSHLHSHLNWIRGIGSEISSGFFGKHPDVIRELAVRLNANDIDIESLLAELVANLKGFELDFFDNIQTRYFLKSRIERVGDQDLREALEHSRMFEAVGLTEAYDEFSRTFCEKNGISYVEQAKTFNRSKHRPLYDHREEKMKQLVHPLIKYDLQLYEQIKKLQ